MNDKLEQCLNWLIPLLCAVTALYALTFPLQDPDTFWHLAYGRAMVEQGRFINHEIFSYTSSGAYLGSHSQLAQVLLYLLWQIGEANALLGFKLLTGLVTFLLVMRTTRLFELGRIPAAFLPLLVILAGMSRFVERPELFSILLQALLILILFGYGRGVYSVRVLWALPVILVSWDYLHGALFGLVILLSFAMGETLKVYLLPRLHFLAGWGGQALSVSRLKMLWLWSGITLVAMTFHPNGLLNYTGFWKVASNSREFAMYGEFMPTRFIPQFFWFWVCLAVFLILGLYCWRRLDLSALFLVLPFLYLGLKYNRATLAFALAAVPLLAWSMKTVNMQLALSSRGAAALAGVSLILLAAIPFYKEIYAPDFFRFGSGLNENAYPVGSARFVAEVGLNGNMFNADGAGGYLAFFLAPQRKIFHYNQPGVFTALTDYVHNEEGRSRWDISYALVTDAKEYAMFLRDGFLPVYREPNAMVLLKPTPEHKALLDNYKIRYFEPLKSLEQLAVLSRNQLAAPRLCEEVAIYLTYRHDERLAEWFAKLLRPGNSDLRVEPKTRRSWLEAAIRQNSGNLFLLQTLGDVAYRQGDLARAEICFDEVLRREPENVEALLNRGYIDYDRQSYRNAATFFSKAIKSAPDRADPHYALGLAAMRQGDKELMEKEFKEFLQMAPQSPFAEKARRFLSEGSR